MWGFVDVFDLNLNKLLNEFKSNLSGLRRIDAYVKSM